MNEQGLARSRAGGLGIASLSGHAASSDRPNLMLYVVGGKGKTAWIHPEGQEDISLTSASLVAMVVTGLLDTRTHPIVQVPLGSR